MKFPHLPPKMMDLISEVSHSKGLGSFLEPMAEVKSQPHYLHWDELRRRTPPGEMSHREWWMVTKMSRLNFLRSIDLKDKQSRSFNFCVPGAVQEELHHIDLGAGGSVGAPEPITNPNTRDRYLISSLMEEAITSSQLEGAVTTREVAKEMIRAGRKPRDTSEQMILNNYVTMQRVRELKNQDLSPQLVFEIHRLVTQETLDDPTAAGRFRRPDERRVVGDDEGEVFHDPPPSEELPERMREMCDFANGRTPGYFVHPAVRAIILHFWLAYDHPFYDGNGRTARALFYWAMLRQGYWLFEFISISSILRKAPVKYARSFLYTETDDNDLTYFLMAQTKVIRSAIQDLHSYIGRKTSEMRQVESHLRALDYFNHRQVELIRHALKHPGHRYSFTSHQKSHNVAYQTARTDLLNLHQRNVLERRKRGKEVVFVAPADLSERMMKLEKEPPF